MLFVKRRIQIMVEILLSVLMTVAMIPILPSAAAIGLFHDVQISDWFSDSVEYVNHHGLMKGTSDTMFEPQTTMSRAMTVTVLYRMEGEPAAEQSMFKDVPADTWFTNSVSWAATEGIVNGYGKDQFGPSDDITREQLAAVLYRYAEKKGYDVSRRGDLNQYVDNGEISDWAKDALSWANAEGLVIGIDDHTLASGANANRAQVAAVLKRFCEGIQKQNEPQAVNPADHPGSMTYTVIFDYNYDGKGAFKTSKVKAGEYTGFTELPTRTGYLFDGWYTEEGKRFDPEKDTIDSDFIVYAHWMRKSADGSDDGMAPTEKKYTVQFDTNGGSGIPDQTVKEGQAMIKPDDPIRANSQFAGWYRNRDLTEAYDFEWTITGNLVLYAKWIEKGNDRSFTDRLIELMPKDKNWTISPYSLEMCLAMVANGTKGKTQEELLEALQIRDPEKYNSEIRTMLETYDGFNSVMSLETANSIWINQDRFQGKGRFQESFSDLLSLNYRAEAREVRDINSVEEINAWADKKTHGKISRILEEDHRQFAVALANAVYFKAAWQNKFYSEATKPQTFYNRNGTESEIPFMHQLDDFAYYEADGIQAVEMPYQNYTVSDADGMKMQFFKDADFGMYFLMSEKELDLQEVLDHAVFRREKVRLTIPKFKMEYGDSLADELKALGVLTAFDPYHADLSGMIDPSDYPGMNRLYLDDVLQKAYLAIDEEGTEAAAVTVAIGKDGAALDPPPVYDFTADHPFYFVIRDNTSSRILFAGKYNNTINDMKPE